MDANGGTNYRRRRSLSSNRFIGLFSQSELPTTFGGSDADITGAELNEAEVFWTGDSVESSRRSTFPTDSGYGSHQRYGNRQLEEFGILTALPDSDRNRIPQNRRSSVTSSRAISAIPKPPQSHQDKEKECSQSLPCRKIQNSVPMNIPKAIMERRRCTFDLINDCHDDDSDEDEMLPPHEIVALQVKTTTSVLEGVGRTLKGRDLRQVRNAVWRQTGFLD
ncbi:hypothetical protein Nepgr_011803 [Nepenthes gracilis]|uniref:Senescence regulator n=1 Tax=Nepenthes gracilis TaxID=150966 RepID=A0AAD3SG57_NEPGR|nr:hypothetical protein Nepgr_011803 [Nepenthes gracilis]